MTNVSSLRAEADLFRRDSLTLACYGMLAMLTLGSGMLGPLIPWLRDALHLSYKQAALHSVAMSVGVAGTALLVPAIATRLGRRGCVALALASVATGTTLVCTAPSIIFSLAGSAVAGAAAPLMITVAPAIMMDRHGGNTRIAMAEANAVAYLGFLLAPAFVFLAALAGSWRLSFVPSIVLGLAFWFGVRALPMGAFQLKSAQGGSVSLPRAYWWHWAMLVLSICAELSLIFFGPSYLEEVLRLPRSEALWAAMVFPGGMAVGRLVVAALLRRYDTAQLVLPSIALAMAGVVMVVWSGHVMVAGAGLLVSAFGMAGLYPFGITLAMQAAGAATDRAAARASLASGVATLAGPLVIGILADRNGINAAFGIVPAFLAFAAIAHVIGRQSTAQA